MGPGIHPADSVVDVVREWYKRAGATQYAHYASAQHYHNNHLWLGIPAIVLSTIVGTTVFASIKAQQFDTWIQVAIGLASVLAAVLAGLQTFFSYSSLVEKHRMAGAKYGIIGRELEYMLADTTQISDAAIREIQKRLADLAVESPNNPPSIYRKAVAALEAATPGKHPAI